LSEWLELVAVTLLAAWLLSLELRYWRTFRAIIIVDSIIKSVGRYARERERNE
jgi:hypothetical protein